MITYRRANPCELAELNHFIRLSKGFWGYTEPFLDIFMEKWGLKESFLQNNEVMLLEKDQLLAGLFAFKINEEKTPELDLFFVDPTKIQQGIGKLMWQYALQYTLDKGWKHFQLIADPNAEGFYKRMGAKTIKQFESFPGRFVPIMHYEIAMEVTY